MLLGTNVIPSVPRFGQTNGFGMLTNQFGMLSNQFGIMTNRFGLMTNQFGTLTNQFGILTNQFGSQLPGTNVVVVTNDFDADDSRFAGTNAVGGDGNQFGALTNQNGSILLPDQGLTPQDKALLAKIRHELLPEIRRHRIAVHLASQNGVVTITGFVPSPQEGQEFVSIAQQTPGVTRVINHLSVAPSQPWNPVPQDEAVTDRYRQVLGDVRGEMRRHRHGQNDFDSVHIVARNGVIELEGSVGSTQEKQALETAVKNTPGVVEVVDELRIGSSEEQGEPGEIGQQGNPAQSGQSGSFVPTLPVPGAGPLSPTSRSNAPMSVFPTNQLGAPVQTNR